MELSGQIHIQAILIPVRNKQEFNLAPEPVWMPLKTDKSLTHVSSRNMLLERPTRSLVTTHTELSQAPLYIYIYIYIYIYLIQQTTKYTT